MIMAPAPSSSNRGRSRPSADTSRMDRRVQKGTTLLPQEQTRRSNRRLLTGASARVRPCTTSGGIRRIRLLRLKIELAFAPPLRTAHPSRYRATNSGLTDPWPSASPGLAPIPRQLKLTCPEANSLLPCSVFINEIVARVLAVSDRPPADCPARLASAVNKLSSEANVTGCAFSIGAGRCQALFGFLHRSGVDISRRVRASLRDRH